MLAMAMNKASTTAASLRVLLLSGAAVLLLVFLFMQDHNYGRSARLVRGQQVVDGGYTKSAEELRRPDQMHAGLNRLRGQGAAAGAGEGPWRRRGEIKSARRRVMIGSTAPTCSFNECRGCRFRCRAEQVPVDVNDPINSAYHYRCVCHRW